MPRRWYPMLPRFDTPVILQRVHEGPSSRIGNQRTGSNVVRVLKAFSTTNAANIDKPTDDPPDDNSVLPGTYATGWTAWWGAPPAPTANPYRIPDPPIIDRPVLPNASNPILWEAYASVADDVIDWEVRISAVYAMVDWKPQTGSEKMSGMRDLSINEAALKMRPSIVSVAGINSKEWNVLRAGDNTIWKLESIVPSFRRGEFVEMMVEKVD